MTPKKNDVWKALGRRKSSVARVMISPGKGEYTINNRSIDNYFGRDVLKMVTRQPFVLLGIDGKYDVSVNVNGGGLSGQAGAIRLGISRGIEKENPDYRKTLKDKYIDWHNNPVNSFGSISNSFSTFCINSSKILVSSGLSLSVEAAFISFA